MAAAPKTTPTLPTLTKAQQQLLTRVWTGAGLENENKAAVVLAREFVIQPWQVKAWATRLGIAKADPTANFYKEIMGGQPRMAQPQAQTRRCAACKHEKSLDQFRERPRGLNGRTRCCLTCLDKRAGRDHYEPETPTSGAIVPLATTILSLPGPEEPQTTMTSGVDTRYEMLYTLLRQLPESGRWSSTENQRWTSAFDGVFAWLVRVDEA